MKKNLKLFISSLIIALTFASPQGIYGMEGSEPGKQDLKRPYALVISSDSNTTEESRQKKRRGKEIRENPFKKCPEEIRLYILKYAVAALLGSGTAGTLSAVSKEWQSIVKDHKIDIFKFAICEVFPIDEETCKRFLNGRLIYKPNENNDTGKIELRIADLANPLEGTFDLSHCGDTGNYLSISTGYRKGRKAGNANKVEIWFTPRFLVENEINGSAQHFQSIFPASWSATAPVGMFWTWGRWDDLSYMDYLTTEDMDNLSKINLYENWQKSECIALGYGVSTLIMRDGGCRPMLAHIHFVN